MTAPALSNFLTVLAVEIAGEVAAYKRSSTAAHVAYLSAGRKLLDARENVPRGQWAPFLAACGGVEPRTARNMMALARAGLTADDVTAAGGVRAALESLRDRPQAETVSVFSPSPGVPLPETVSAIEASKPVPGPVSVYQWRRARGLCVDCGEPSAGKARCTRHRAAVLDADRRRRALAANRVVREMGIARGRFDPAMRGEPIDCTVVGAALDAPEAGSSDVCQARVETRRILKKIWCF